MGTARALNKDFHFTIFGLSPLTLLVAEIERIWAWAMPYHTVSLNDPAGRARFVAEHRAMIDALAAGRRDEVIALMNDHRDGSGVALGLMLQAVGNRSVAGD